MELPAGADAKLAEHLAQVVLNGAGADVEPRTAKPCLRQRHELRRRTTANPLPPRSESRRGLGANAVLDLTVYSTLGAAILGLRAIGPAGGATGKFRPGRQCLPGP